MVTARLIESLADPSGSQAYLYSAASAIVVALIGATAGILIQRLKVRDSTRSPTRKTVTILSRYEKFFLVNGIDSRKIKNGLERLEDVQIERPD